MNFEWKVRVLLWVVGLIVIFFLFDHFYDNSQRVSTDLPVNSEVSKPSLSKLINADCGFLLREGMLERFNKCQARVVDSYQVAFGD